MRLPALWQFSLEDADISVAQCRRRILEDGDAEGKIPRGARKTGSLAVRREDFDLMAKFAEYGFNKSHSAAYAS